MKRVHRAVKTQWKLRYRILAGIALVVAGFSLAYGIATLMHQPAKLPPVVPPIVTKTENTPPPQPAYVNEPFVPDFTLPVAVNGRAPVITQVVTKQPVVFLGIDDGAYKDPSVVQALKDNHIKASLYLAKMFISNNPQFFKQIVDNGSLIEDHTLDHDTKMTKDQTYEQQKAQICGMADYEQQQYGRRPVFFRPPGGAYSDSLLKAANDCGMKAVVTWIAKANGGSMQYQIGNKLRPGDVVLMHFRPEFKQDLKAFVDAQNAAGLHTVLLEDALSQ